MELKCSVVLCCELCCAVTGTLLPLHGVLSSCDAVLSDRVYTCVRVSAVELVNTIDRPLATALLGTPLLACILSTSRYSICNRTLTVFAKSL